MRSSKTKYSPYLSIIIPFRNDNYSPNAIEKLNFSINILKKQLDDTQISAEIIIVDWNSPDPNKPLIDEILIDQNTEHVSVIVFEVGNEIHRKYKGFEKRNLVGEAAFNVGIRRSRGKFIVGKVSDTFFSSSLIDFISSKNLDEKSVYRLDRVDIKTSFPVPADWESHFKNNIILRKSSSGNGLHVKACGDFLLMARKVWFGIRGYPEINSVVHHGADGEALHAAVGYGAKQVYLKGDNCIYKIAHDGMYGSRVNHNMKSSNGSLKKLIFGDFKRNIFQKIAIIKIRIALGILNLPRTKISNVKTRSIYRYYLVANFRRLFFGASFIKNKNWGLKKIILNPKILLHASWDK